MESFIKQFTQNIFERTKESLTSEIPEVENFTIIQIRQKMDKFEIPFIPQEVETSKPEAILTT